MMMRIKAVTRSLHFKKKDMKKNTGKPESLFLDNENICMATDLYQLTMVAGYFERGINHKSTFELFVRDLPEKRSYLIAAGLEQAIYYLKNLRFTAEYLKYLKNLPVFKNVSRAFLNIFEIFVSAEMSMPSLKVQLFLRMNPL